MVANANVIHDVVSEIELDGEKHTISLKITEIPRDEPRRKTGRAYVWTDEVLRSKLGDHPSYTARGEDEANDKAWDEYNQAEIRQLRQVLDAAWATYRDTKLSATFSRVAGCGCGCSPGFRLGRESIDVYVGVI